LNNAAPSQRQAPRFWNICPLVPATNIVPMITRVDHTIAIASESLLPPQFSQIDRDREHEVCHEQPLHDRHAEVFSLGSF
jgi:hypothetical protein